MLTSVAELHQALDEVLLVNLCTRADHDGLEAVVVTEMLQRCTNAGHHDVRHEFGLRHAPPNFGPGTHGLNVRTDSLERQGIPRTQHHDRCGRCPHRP